jgi:hypothetical protein
MTSPGPNDPGAQRPQRPESAWHDEISGATKLVVVLTFLALLAYVVLLFVDLFRA